ncbi:hypothetical protein [Microvirga roseola]|uniref:hypothetical protein n=1 Tax=Microvirga roseola TaxID=2883126 RepID=UPI001E649A2A|nr:hypothetical protein [Microvirga roseola]
MSNISAAIIASALWRSFGRLYREVSSSRIRIDDPRAVGEGAWADPLFFETAGRAFRETSRSGTARSSTGAKTTGAPAFMLPGGHETIESEDMTNSPNAVSKPVTPPASPSANRNLNWRSQIGISYEDRSANPSARPAALSALKRALRAWRAS